MSIALSINLNDLFSKALKVPDYQRPYTWTEKQVKPLLEDLYAFFQKNNANNIPVLLGSTILFKNKIIEKEGEKEVEKDIFEIVDGQQRLTTLAIILHCLGNTNTSFLSQSFTHQKSIDNIKVNQKIINDFIGKKEVDKGSWVDFILEKVHFIEITAPTLDDAFVFFDSQNNRGKTLADYDVLKAHHLRYIADNALATACAKDWERIDKNKDNAIGLAHLLDTILGRGRKWSKGEHNRLVLMDEFKSQRFEKSDSRQYHINRYQQPPIFESWSYLPEKGQEASFSFHNNFDAAIGIGTKRMVLQANSVQYLPFQITQTIEGGELFFWYTEKYYALYKELFDDKNPNTSVFFKELKQKANDLSGKSEENLYNTWIGSLLFYYDKFGYIEFDKIASSFFYALYFLRIRHSRQIGSIPNFMNEKIAIFKIIHEASYHGYILHRIDEFVENIGSDFKNEISNIQEQEAHLARRKFWDIFYQKEGFFLKNENKLQESIKTQLSKLNQ